MCCVVRLKRKFLSEKCLHVLRRFLLTIYFLFYEISFFLLNENATFLSCVVIIYLKKN